MSLTVSKPRGDCPGCCGVDVPSLPLAKADGSAAAGGEPPTGVFEPSDFVIALRILGGSCNPKPIPALLPTESPTVTPVVG